MLLPLIQNEPNKMYRINPFWTEKTKFEPFICPENFDPDAQELNIVKIFNDFDNLGKQYISLINSSVTNSTCPQVNGGVYYYSENGNYPSFIISGTINWTSGSNKRYIITCSNKNDIVALNGAVWVHSSSNINSINIGRSNINYITASGEIVLDAIGSYAFYACYQLTGNIKIPNTVTYIGQDVFSTCENITGELAIPESVLALYQYCFYGMRGITGISIPATITIIRNQVFYNCTSVSRIDCRLQTPIAIYNETFSGVNKSIPFHVPTGRKQAYQSAQYWNEFTNIIDDL